MMQRECIVLSKYGGEGKRKPTAGHEKGFDPQQDFSRQDLFSWADRGMIQKGF